MALANLNEDLLFSFFGIFKLLSSCVNILREQNSTSSTICVDIQTSIGKVQCDQGFHGGCVMECVVECVGGCGRVCVVRGCVVRGCGGVCGERVCGGVCEKGEGVWLWSVRCVEVQLYIPP